jgi:exopolyphosphatase / guanosine-5'-triphosphate,3'-diphosphate pyrophosphatase
MRVATIDIGTNTVLLLVAETGPAGDLVAVSEHATITRLGEGVDKTRTLSPGAIERTTACLDRYAEIVAASAVERVAVVGTSAMRDAGGGEAIRAHVLARFGVEARTISGDEEARLTFAGALSGLERGRGARAVVFDIGGGSTEVVCGAPGSGTLELARSLDVGSVRLTERHITSDPPSREERDAVARDADAAFAGLPELTPGSSPPVGIAGTMTTLAAVSLGLERYDAARVHGLALEVAELERVVDRLAALPLEQRRQVKGLEPKRADVIVAGGMVALALLARLSAREVIISDRGVRWGLAEELAGGA